MTPQSIVVEEHCLFTAEFPVQKPLFQSFWCETIKNGKRRETTGSIKKYLT